jgi:hypothetical protein
MSKQQKAPKFNPGDVVYRLWESGAKTLGIITDDYRFEALESYEDEGKVTVGETCGLGSFEYELVKQETLEEAAEKCRKKWLNDQSISINNIFSEGANWQAQRMYSEEECYRTLHTLMMEIHFSGLVINDDMDLKEWFEQHKKK